MTAQLTTTRKPTTSKQRNIALDVVLCGIFLLLLLPIQATIGIHIGLGVLLLTLIGIHLYQHRRWFKALVKGRWNSKRFRKTALTALLAVAVLLVIGSGLFLLSNYEMNIVVLAQESIAQLAQDNAFLVSSQFHHLLGRIGFLLCIVHSVTILARRFSPTARTIGN